MELAIASAWIARLAEAKAREGVNVSSVHSVLKIPLALGVVVLAVGVCTSASQIAAPVKTAGAAGTVVDGGTGRPVASALVTIGWRSDSGAPRSVTKETNQSGQFVVEGLPAGVEVSVRASKSGYLDGEYGQEDEGKPGRHVSLMAGQQTSDLRVPLWRQGAIAGQVLFDGGDPVGRCVVRVLRVVWIAGARHLATGPGAWTDDLGAFRIAGLPPGRYLVQVASVQMTVGDPTRAGQPIVRSAQSALEPTASGARTLVYPGVFFPDAISADRAREIEIRGGNDERVDFVLQAVPSVKVAGTVKGPADAVSDLTVRLIAVGSEGLGQASETALTRTDHRGGFVLLGVPSGSYTLEIVPSTAEFGWVGASPLSKPIPIPTLPASPNRTGSVVRFSVGGATEGVNVVGRSSSGARWARASIEVKDKDVSGLEVTLQPPGQIEGHVVLERAQATGAQSVTSAVGFSVFAEPADGAMDLGLPVGQTSPTDPGQPFSITGLMPGRYFLRVWNGPTIKSISIRGADYTHRPIQMTDGESISDVELTLTDGPATVRGTVTNMNGTPATNASVLCYPVDSQEWTNFGLNPDRIRIVRTATNGTYQAPRLPAGDYFVVALSDDEADSWQEPGVLGRVAAKAKQVSLAWKDAKVVDLRVSSIK